MYITYILTCEFFRGPIQIYVYMLWYIHSKMEEGGGQPSQESYHTNMVTRKKGRERKERKEEKKNLKSQISNLAYSRLFTE